MAKAGARQAHNHFGNVGVGLYPELDFGERADRIAEDLAQRRRRAATSGDACGEPGVRRGARAVITLGRRAIRPDGAVADRHRQHRRVQRQPRCGRPAFR